MLPHHWARCQVFSSVRRQRPAGPACRSSGTHYSYGTVEYGTIDLKSRSNRSNPALAAAGCGLAGWAALTPARSAQQGSQPGGIRAGRAITWVKIQKCRNEESSRKVPRDAGEARGSSTGWPRAMGVKIKLKSDYCSFRPMISLI